MKVESEEQYRNAYTEGYQRAIKDLTVYNIPKNVAKKFSIEILPKWKNFEDEFYEDFQTPPNPQQPIKIPLSRKTKLKFLYIMKMKLALDIESTSFYKIGIATNIKKRLSSLQTGSPIELEVYFKFRTHYAEVTEKLCHEHFHNYRTSGEWFAIDNNVMGNFVKNDFMKIDEYVNENYSPESFKKIFGNVIETEVEISENIVNPTDD